MALPIEQDPAEPFTFAELDGRPDDGRRRELIGGSLVVSPAPLGAHRWCAMVLAATLHAARPSDILAIPAPYDWQVDATGEASSQTLP